MIAPAATAAGAIVVSGGGRKRGKRGVGDGMMAVRGPGARVRSLFLNNAPSRVAVEPPGYMADPSMSTPGAGIDSSIQSTPAGRPSHRHRWWWCIAGAALLALGIAVLAYWWADAPARAAAAETRAALARNRLAEAERAVARWVRLKPDSAEAHFERGRVLASLDRPQEALDAFDRARALGYREAPLERAVGLLLERSGRVREAEPLLERARERDQAPDSELDAALARLYLNGFRLGRAMEALDRWAAAAPQDPTPWNLRAEVDLRLNSGPRIVGEDYQEALRRDPRHDRARLGLAGALAAQGLYDEAIDHYQVYLNAHPDDVKALVGAGRAALDAGRPDEAMPWLDRALEIDPKDIAVLDARAAAALRRGRAAEALELIDRALAIDPNDNERYHRRALALDRLGRRDEARAAREAANRLRREFAELEDLRVQLMKTPRDRDLQSRLAHWLLDHDRDEEGLLWARRALEGPGGHPATARLLADYYDRKGQAGLANFYRTQAEAADAKR
jgi:tetratricopeptide (TPR) repeat protein